MAKFVSFYYQPGTLGITAVSIFVLPRQFNNITRSRYIYHRQAGVCGCSAEMLIIILSARIKHVPVDS